MTVIPDPYDQRSYSMDEYRRGLEIAAARERRWHFATKGAADAAWQDVSTGDGETAHGIEISMPGLPWPNSYGTDNCPHRWAHEGRCLACGEDLAMWNEQRGAA